MHGLKERVPGARVEIGAGGDAEPSDESRAQIGEDVAVEVVRYDHLEALWLTHKLECQRVDIAVLGRDLRVLPRDRLELVLPDPMRGNRVGLVTHGDPSLGV